MRKRELFSLLLIIVLIVIPIKNGYGWNFDYQMNKGTEIPFESSELTHGYQGDDGYLVNDMIIADMVEVNYTLTNYPPILFPVFDLENYFYIIIGMVYRSGDSKRILSLEFDGDQYTFHIRIINWNVDVSYYDPYEYKSIILKISRTYYEGNYYLGSAEYISKYDSNFLIYVVLYLLIITRIIYLKSKKRPILGSFFDSKYISRDNLTKDTLKDLERREELKNAMDEEN